MKSEGFQPVSAWSGVVMNEPDVVETDEWAAYIEENYLTEDIRWGEDFGTFLEETQGQFETILKEQGAL